MIFKIKWGDMESLIKKRYKLQEERKSPTFYFESEEEIYIYQFDEGIILSSSVLKEPLDLVAFKQEYLADAVELTEKPKEGHALVIRQE